MAKKERKAKKKKEVYVPKTGLLGNARDYAVYKLPLPTRILCMAAGFAAGSAIGHVFYENLILSVLVGGICCAYTPGMWRKRVIQRRRDKLLLQFRDLLESLSTSLGAGSNMQDAFKAAADDLQVRYSRESDIVQELIIINSGILNNLSIEDLLLDFGDRAGLDDIVSFANVFETCYRKGGNIREVIRNTYLIICDKIDILLEIRTVVASGRLEQNAMTVMPIVFVALLKGMGNDIIDLTSLVGMTTTTIAVLLFVVASFMSKKILDIKV